MANYYHDQAPGREDLPQGLWNPTPAPVLQRQAMDFDFNLQDVLDFLANEVEEPQPNAHNDAPLDPRDPLFAAPMHHDAAFPLDPELLIDLWPEVPLDQQPLLDLNGWIPSPAEMPPAPAALPLANLELEQLARELVNLDTPYDLFFSPLPDHAAAYPAPSASSAASHSTGYLTPPTSPSSTSSPASATHAHACPEPSCSASFARRAELTKHSHKHTRPFKCRVCGRGHAAKKDMQRHVETHHPDQAGALGISSSKARCPVPGCDFAGVLQRSDNLKRHMETRHPGWSGGTGKGKARRRRG